MNPLTAISTLWRIGREGGGAWEKFQDTIASGGSIADAVAAFAKATPSTEMDDVLADQLVQSLQLGVDYLGKTAEILAVVATVIEENGPAIIETCRSLSIRATKLAMEMQRIRG